MSVEQAKAFAKKALKDPAILEKLNSDGADIFAIAKEHGLEFDEEHIEAGQAHLESLLDEMSDEELDDVAGGGFGPGGLPLSKHSIHSVEDTSKFYSRRSEKPFF